MTCINLEEIFGDRYRITWDPAYDPSHVPHDKRDPWMMQIPCEGKGVTIYPYGGTTLAVEVNRRPSIANKLTRMEGVKLHQDGSTETTFLFDVTLFEAVAAIVNPKRRRRVTPTQLAALLKHQRRFEVGAQKSKLERAPTPQGDTTITQAEVGPVFFS